MDKNLTLLVPKPDLSASLSRSLAGSDPGLKMNTIGFVDALCSKMFSKLKKKIMFTTMNRKPKKNHDRQQSNYYSSI